MTVLQYIELDLIAISMVIGTLCGGFAFLLLEWFRQMFRSKIVKD